MVAPSGIPARLRSHPLFPTSDDVRRLWAPAVPVVVVRLGRMLVGVVTTVVVGHVSATDLGAVAPGNLRFV